MDVLTHGFVDFVESAEWECDGAISVSSGVFPRDSHPAGECCSSSCSHLSLVQPVLQLIDIQRDTRAAPADSRSKEKEYYYAAMSDGSRVVWCAIPPKSMIGNYIANFELEVGCCLTVQRYTVVRSPLGMHTPILLMATFIPTPVALIGLQSVDYHALRLSPLALRKSVAGSTKTAAPEGEGMMCDSLPTVLPLSEVSQTRNAWSIRVRVLWRGRLRRSTRRAHSSPGRTGKNTQFEMETVVVDAQGCCVTAVFSGDAAIADALDVGDCVEMSGGKVRWSSAFSDDACGAGKEREESEGRATGGRHEGLQWYTLSFGGRSKVLKLPNTPELPYAASRELGRPNVCFSSVESVVASALPGTMTSVVGLVTECSDRIPTNTKRGRVDRRAVKLCDTNSAEHSITITLWDELASSVYAAPGSLWCFRDFYVRVFNQRKTLSSCSSSEVFPSETAVVLRRAAECNRVEVIPPCVLEMSRHRSERVHFSLTHVVDFPHLHRGARERRVVLLRVQNVFLPLFHLVCPSCQATRLTHPQCEVCRASTFLSYSIRLAVSDGEETIDVVGDEHSGTALFGLSVEDFASFCARNARFESKAVQELIGQPLLGRLTVIQTSAEHIVELQCCEDTSVADCARAALQAVEVLDARH